MTNLKDKTVLVTAGGSGIGLGIAKAFLAQGSTVYVCDISSEALHQASKENPGLKGIVADVGDHDNVARLFKEIDCDGVEVDVLVNNAGVAGPTAFAEDIHPEEWEKTINVNLNGMFYCIREALPAMKKRQSGVILNISSCSARVGMTRRLPYVASKVGVLGMNYALARELGRFNIRVNAILPGAVDRPRLRTLLNQYANEEGISETEAMEETLSYVSMRTCIDPSEIGDMAVFLASNAARHITGQAISVDGLIEWEA